MLIKKYKSKIESIINPLAGIFTVTFSSEKKFVYNPGQFLHLALDKYDGIGQWPESRCFSMQSNPSEDLIKITYAAKGKYTNRMADELKVGKEVWLKLPYGDIFDRGHSKEKCVFIAGGTGITPFLSLFTCDSFKEYINPSIYLGFRSLDFNLYIKELNKVTSGIVKMFYENTDGTLDIKTILDECGHNSTFFISGPPIMIKMFKKYLITNDVPEQNVITDDWE